MTILTAALADPDQGGFTPKTNLEIEVATGIMNSHLLHWQRRLSASGPHVLEDAVANARDAVQIEPGSCIARLALCDALELAQ